MNVILLLVLFAVVVGLGVWAAVMRGRDGLGGRWRPWAGMARPGKSQIAVMLVMALLCLAAIPAVAQVAQTLFGDFLSGNATATNAQTITATSTAVTLKNNRGIAVYPLFVADGAATQNVTFTFDVSYDGTNYTTTHGLSAVFALNGTTAVRGYKLFDPATLNHARKIKLATIANGSSATVTISNVIWSVVSQ